MASSEMFVYKCLVVILLVCLLRSTLAVDQCQHTDVKVIDEDGNEKVIAIKDADRSCDGDRRSVETPRRPGQDTKCGNPETKQARVAAKIKAQGKHNGRAKDTPGSKTNLFHSTNSQGLLYKANRIVELPFHGGQRSIELAPIVTIYITDVITSMCSQKLDESEVCKGFKTLSMTCKSGATNKRELVEKYANYLVDNGLIPVPTGDRHADTRIAYGLVLLGANMVDEAEEYFSMLIKEFPNLAAAYHGRGMAIARQGFTDGAPEKAIEDFSKAAELEPENPEHYQRRAELYIPLGRYTEAMASINRALSLDSYNFRAYFLKATLEFAQEDLKEAEQDYRNSLNYLEEAHTVHTYYNLALTLYYRGMYRNSIEVFKELVKRSSYHITAHASLAHVYSQLGDEKNAFKMFNLTITKDPKHILTRQLKGTHHYNSGETNNALREFKTCLHWDPDNYLCQYMNGLVNTACGNFYQGIKAFTKVIVHKNPPMRMTPEFIKSHYLREYARLLHHNLDVPITETKLDEQLSPEFKDKWLKKEPFVFSGVYEEQPGMSPSIPDISPPVIADLPLDMRELLCLARSLGMSMYYPTDGFLGNNREEIAMGLSTIHIAQMMQKIWKNITKKSEPEVSWRDIFDVAVSYRRLVNPEEPVLWLDQMPEEEYRRGYVHDYIIVRGHTINVRMMHYFDLVYRLIKTMVSIHCGEGEMYEEIVMHELLSIETYEDMIDVFKKDLFREQGYVMSTQVPSVKEPDSPKLDGVLLSLSGNSKGKVQLSVNFPFNKTRADRYHEELDFVFSELYNHIKTTDLNSTEDPDQVISLILSLVYYFLNLSPLSHGTSAVAWSVAVGLIMSVGRETQGRISSGKLLDMEAALSGGPDVFTMVSKKWMNIRQIHHPVDVFTPMWEAFPALRDVLEVLTVSNIPCWDVYLKSDNLL